MTNGESSLYRIPEAREIAEYLRIHGPSTTSTMKEAGLKVPTGLLKRMHQLGLIRAVGEVVPGNTKIWELFE